MIKVEKADIDDLLKESEIIVEKKFDSMTVVWCKLPSGFILHETSACIDPDNYDEEIGKEICMEQIKHKLWELEGYALMKKLNER